ncbi:MAG: 50S ribosomal protein L9 [Phycisphaerae bacterium]|nr:50S ribosomal protein L9 [Phycisphaerae bacterium]
MKLLLLEDVEMLGWLGDVVEVKDGYARNYLLPQGLATVPTEANMRSLAGERARRAESRQLEREQKQQLASSMEDVEVVLAAKANELGHLFGSVAERDIAENLRQQGFAVQDAMVKMPGGHIKEIGAHDVTLKIAPDLNVVVRVIVVSQDETIDAVEEQTSTEE